MTKKKLFLNYSPNDPEDVTMLSNLRLHLGLLRNHVEEWSVDKFEGGDEKEKVINSRFKEADAVVHLLSVQFDNTDDCLKLLQRSVEDKKKIVPILISSFYWQGNPLLVNLESKMLPNSEEPLSFASDIKSALTQIIATVSRDVLEIDAKINTKSDRWFYYTLAGIVLIIGLLASLYVQRELQNGLYTGVCALMFLCVVIFVLRKVIFPTNLSSLN